MATSTPPQASKRPAGGGTPSHLNHSSPVRHVSGKTPINHPTTGSTGSKTMASTPMVQTLSQGITSSPSANMLSFNTPAGLGLDVNTPAGQLPTPGLGGIPMAPSLSELGLTMSGGKRNDDEERRAKMRKVLRTIGRPKGRVSEEGIARISRRVGFQNDIDAEKLLPGERERKVGNRPILTAGKCIVIELDLRNHIPQSLTVSFNAEPKILKEQEDLAAKVLFDDLKATEGTTLSANLDQFAANLERLARMDRLSNSINCFKAISGIYTTLERLHDREITVAGTSSRDTAEYEVMCKKSGKPLIHQSGKIGLELHYWCRDRSTSHKDHASENDTFRLQIEVEASSAGLYPPLRVSDSWLLEDFELPGPDSTDAIPWQDPPPTFLNADVNASAMAVDGEQNLPNLRFVTKLDPPIVMPYQVAMNVLSAVGVPAPQMLVMPPQYAALLLDSHASAPGLPFTKTTERRVLSQKDGTETTVTHRYTLSSAKTDYGFKLEELPFSHPRQLVELLPILRQWASVESLLKEPFAETKPSRSAPNGVTEPMRRITLDDILANNHTRQDAIAVSVAISTMPLPTLSITFPSKDGSQVGSVNVQILPNARAVVTNHEGITLPNLSESTQTSQKLAKGLDACGDLGVWIEWMRIRTT